jgi:hypothetical protein
MGQTRTFVYEDNTGGVNLRSNEAKANGTEQGTEFLRIQNFQIYKDGGFSAQKGNTQLNTGVTDDTKILGIGQYRTTNTTYAIYTKASGKAYAMDVNGGAETEIKTGLNATAIPQFVEFNGKVQCFNGQDTPWEWNGSGSGSNLTGLPAAWTTTKPHAAGVHKGTRIHAAAGDTLYYCALGDENDWTTVSDAGSITDIFNDVTEITAVYPYANAMGIHTNAKSIYTLSGTSPSSYTADQKSTNRAALSKLGIAVIDNMQYFYSGDGILPLMTTDFNVIKLGYQSDIASKIQPFLTASDTELPMTAASQLAADKKTVILLPYYDSNELVCYFKQDGDTTYNIAWIYNFNLGAWVYRKASPVTAAALVDGKVLTGTSDGKILQEFSGATLATGDSFQKNLLSAWTDFGSPTIRKQIKRAWYWFKTSQNLDITMNFRKDFDPSIIIPREITESSNTAAAAYGSGAYGYDNYASSTLLTVDFPLNMQFKDFQWEMVSDDNQQDYRLIRYAFEVEYLDAY